MSEQYPPDDMKEQCLGIMLHNIGHLLGLSNEYCRPSRAFTFDTDVLYQDYLRAEYEMSRNDPNRVNPDELKSKAIKLGEDTLYASTMSNFSKFDQKSVMVYKMPKRWILEPKDYPE
jgi:hypothetical protein